MRDIKDNQPELWGFLKNTVMTEREFWFYYKPALYFPKVKLLQGSFKEQKNSPWKFSRSW